MCESRGKSQKAAPVGRRSQNTVVEKVLALWLLLSLSRSHKHRCHFLEEGSRGRCELIVGSRNHKSAGGAEGTVGFQYDGSFGVAASPRLSAFPSCIARRPTVSV